MKAKKISLEIQKLEKVIVDFNNCLSVEPYDKEKTAESFYNVLQVLAAALASDVDAIVPVEFAPEALEALGIDESSKVGDAVELKQDVRFKLRMLNTKSGDDAYVCFTGNEEKEKGLETSSVTLPLARLLDKTMLTPGVGGLIINPWENDIFITKDMLARVWSAAWKIKNEERLLKEQKEWEDKEIHYADNATVEEAIKFAVDAHRGGLRKGTTKPYITHPLEVMTILNSMGADNNLLIAGLLHDTVEDTDITVEQIKEKFGEDVAHLVAGHSEDKSRGWYERKLNTIESLAYADKRHKMLVMADKLANLRSLAADYKRLGDELWKRFNAPEELQGWYYSKSCDAFDDFQDDEDIAPLYWELQNLFKDTFVIFLLDEKKERLYQLCCSGEDFMLDKGNPEWKKLQGNVSKKAVRVERKHAERLEDSWNEPFWKCHDKDMTDGEYEIFSSKARTLTIKIENGTLRLHGQDFGKGCKSINGEDEYEFAYSLDEFSTHCLLTQLRMKYSLRNKLSTILQKEFGYDDGSERFKAYCDELGMPTEFWSR